MIGQASEDQRGEAELSSLAALLLAVAWYMGSGTTSHRLLSIVAETINNFSWWPVLPSMFSPISLYPLPRDMSDAKPSSNYFVGSKLSPAFYCFTACQWSHKCWQRSIRNTFLEPFQKRHTLLKGVWTWISFFIVLCLRKMLIFEDIEIP